MQHVELEQWRRSQKWRVASDVEENEKKIVREQNMCQRKGMSRVVNAADVPASVQVESDEREEVQWESHRWLCKGSQ